MSQSTYLLLKELEYSLLEKILQKTKDGYRKSDARKKECLSAMGVDYDDFSPKLKEQIDIASDILAEWQIENVLINGILTKFAKNILGSVDSLRNGIVLSETESLTTFTQGQIEAYLKILDLKLI